MKRRLFLQGLFGASTVLTVGNSIGKTKQLETPDWQKVGSKAEVPTVKPELLENKNKKRLPSTYFREIIDYDISKDLMVVRFDMASNIDNRTVVFDFVKFNQSELDILRSMAKSSLEQILIGNPIKLHYPANYIPPKIPVG